jgi:citrate lyase beta subunit
MKSSLTTDALSSIRAELKKSNATFNAAFPGAPFARQAVHTVYGGAQIFSATTARKMSDVALRFVDEYAPTPQLLAEALGLPGGMQSRSMWKVVHERMIGKLKREAVEDFRIDFEDGYGTRPDAEEDGHAAQAAREVATGMKQKSLPPFIGIRIKPLSEECAPRSLRTLDIFLSTLLAESGNKLPDNFVVTLPKITHAGQSVALSQALAQIEKSHKLPSGTLKLELMVETTQAILDQDGRCPLREFVAAADGRCIGAHFGTYDYTAGCDITAQHQTMLNPVCDFAKHMMKVALAGTPVMLSDGATNIMPVGPHRAPEGGELDNEQMAENVAVVHRAWQLSYAHVMYSLKTGFYQGWDLHPGQLPVRYAAVYAFFLESAEAASARLKAFVEKAAKATLLGDVFDDAATGQGLLNFFLRGMSCGAIAESEALATGLTIAEFQSRSFKKILDGRTGK